MIPRLDPPIILGEHLLGDSLRPGYATSTKAET